MKNYYVIQKLNMYFIFQCVYFFKMLIISARISRDCESSFYFSFIFQSCRSISSRSLERFFGNWSFLKSFSFFSIQGCSRIFFFKITAKLRCLSNVFKILLRDVGEFDELLRVGWVIGFNNPICIGYF